MNRDNLKYTNVVLERIAGALEETLRLIKKDQEESKKRWEASDQRDDEYHAEVDKWVDSLAFLVSKY